MRIQLRQFKDLSKAALVLAILILTTGCRLGNRIELGKSPDPYSGYYYTEPASLVFNASSSTSSLSKSVSTSLMPTEVARVMTNPIYLSVTNLSSGKAQLLSPLNKAYLPIYVGSGSSLYFQGATDSSDFWVDSSCKYYLEVVEQGTFEKTSEVPEIDGNKYPLDGRLAVMIQMTTVFESGCSATLQTISDCYQDATQCGGLDSDENDQLQTFARALFQPWVDAGDVALADIPLLTSYGYTASFE